MAGDVIAWESHRGRASEFEEVEAGTAIITLNNRHAKYDPTNGGSPYSGGLLPLRQSRITAAKPTSPNSWIPQFTGYVEDWNFKRRGPKHGRAEVLIVDGFDVLANAEISPSTVGGTYYAAQQTDDRQRAALADAGWPAIRTQINTGNVDTQPVIYPPGTTAIEVCRDASEAEFPGVGMIFMTKNGTYRFLGRCARFNQVSPDWRLGDAGARALDPSLIPIKDVEWTYEKEHLYNKVLVLPAGVQAKNIYVVKDQASIDKYGVRGLTFTDLLIQAGTTTGKTALAECRDVFATYYRDNYKRPYVRAKNLTLSASFADPTATHLSGIWDFILGVELGQLIELNTVHPGGGGMAGHLFYVEGIHNYVTAEPYKWRQVLDLSPKGRFDQRSYLGC